MARVNHKLIRQRLNEKCSRISDKQFFTSRLLAKHFEEIVLSQSKRYSYSRKVSVFLYWNPEDKDNVAYTNGRKIIVNCGHELITKIKGRENRYWAVFGLISHEFGHIQFTDFLAGQSRMRFLSNGTWYPTKLEFHTFTDISNEKDLFDYIKDEDNNKALMSVAHQVHNVLEDGYIETRVMNDYPGTLKFSLQKIRDIQYESMPTLTQMKESESEGGHIFMSIMNMFLSYSKWGKIKYGDEQFSDERIKAITDHLDMIDGALFSKNPKTRFDLANYLLVKWWRYVKDFCEEVKQEAQNCSDGTLSGVAEVLKRIFQTMTGSSQISEGNEFAADSDENETTAKNNVQERSQTKAQAVKSDDDSESAETNFPKKDCSDETENQSESNGEGITPTNERLPYCETEDVSEPEGGTVNYDSEYEGKMSEQAAKDIEKILDQMNEAQACESLENDRTRELNDFAKGISYGDIHKGVNVTIRRISKVSDNYRDEYATVAAPLLNISRRLQKSIVKNIQQKRRGSKINGLLLGRRIDSHSLYRTDGKLFYNNSLPNETPELAVGLLLDESGSMWGDRATYARAAAIILYDFCDSLDIPVIVYGHTTSYSEGVELYSYAEFESYDKDDRYRLMDVQARNSNRDGAAIRFVAERLVKRPEQVKLLIIVSDGQPAATGYCGSAAEDDLRGIKHEYQKRGITFVAAAIGEDKENIERIYGDAFMDISDLTKLPEKLTNVVKKHINI